jgi:ferric-dicitrate binding protein FerR (iron transport regulator)
MDTPLELPLPLRPRRTQAPEAVVRLAAQATVARRLRAGTSIAVQSGRIWLTQAGDANDYFVDAGQRHVVARAGHVVIEAFPPHATLRIGVDAPAARPGFP